MNELTIPLKNNSKTPLYEQIYQYIKLNIQSGHLSYGEKLPSTRALSKHLTVSSFCLKDISNRNRAGDFLWRRLKSCII